MINLCPCKPNIPCGQAYGAVISDEEFKLIAEDRKGQALSLKEFKQLYHLCTDEKYNFMYIKKEYPDIHRRIRRNFNTILYIEKEDDENNVE